MAICAICSASTLGMDRRTHATPDGCVDAITREIETLRLRTKFLRARRKKIQSMRPNDRIAHITVTEAGVSP